MEDPMVDPVVAAVEQLTRVVATASVVFVIVAGIAIILQCYLLVLKGRENV